MKKRYGFMMLIFDFLSCGVTHTSLYCNGHTSDVGCGVGCGVGAGVGSSVGSGVGCGNGALAP